MKKKPLVVDTAPVDSHSGINLGIHIVANLEETEVVSHRALINPDEYDEIYFNIFYVTNLFNMISFLKRNNISKNTHTILAGGQGVSNLKGCIDDIVSATFKGEYDHNSVNGNGWHWASSLVSEPLIRGKYAIVELTRGCKYNCQFCEYRHVFGGKYREKAAPLILEQLEKCKAAGVKLVNLLSANIAGYSVLDLILEYAAGNNLRIVNSDITVMDAPKMLKWYDIFRTFKIKLGVESFDYNTRKAIGKGFTDAQLLENIKLILESTRGAFLHFYLIYGLPQDNYEKWFEWLKQLGELRRYYTIRQAGFWEDKLVPTRPIIFQFSLTDFMPCHNTPMESCSPVDFSAKDEFLNRWVKALVAEGFLPKHAIPDYSKARGHQGVKENHYRLLYLLRYASPSTSTKLIDIARNPTGISISNEFASEVVRELEGI